MSTGGIGGQLAAALPGDDAVPAVAEGGDEGEALGDAAEGGELAGTGVEPDVGEHHRPQDGLAGEGHPERLAHGAADAVRADGVAGAQRAGDRAVRPGALHVHLDAVRVLPQAGHPGAAADLRARLDGPLLQQPLGLVLRCHQHAGEAGGQPGQVGLGGAEEADAGEEGAGVDQLLGEPAGVQHLQGAGVHGEGPGEVGLLIAPLQHDDAHTGGGQIPGEQQSGGAGADDQDIDAGFGRKSHDSSR
ncbi:hypothetical protein GCM10020000_32790 [Streptomyces olivoverticillatus]